MSNATEIRCNFEAAARMNERIMTEAGLTFDRAAFLSKHRKNAARFQRKTEPYKTAQETTVAVLDEMIAELARA